MVRTIAPLLACAAPLVAALQYALPKELIALSGCYYPANFTISEFLHWMPVPGNTQSKQYLWFKFEDTGTDISTLCFWNASSKPTADSKPGLTPRYPCDHKLASFIWQDDSITMLETVCPGKTGTQKFEASGSVSPTMSECSPEPEEDPEIGEGTTCSHLSAIFANFTSLQPVPQ